MLAQLTRGGFAAVALAALLLGGCRSNTDRIRVLEAEKNDMDRKLRNQNEEMAKLRSDRVAADSRAESAEAYKLAAERELALVKERPDPARSDLPSTRELQKRLGGDATVTRGPEGTTITLRSDITFAPGKSDLSARAEQTLGKVVRTVRDYGGAKQIRIEGHTDSDPIKKSGFENNEHLSLERARSVERFLVSHGFDQAGLKVYGHGATHPIATNDTKKGKAQNRRVEIILVDRR